MTKPRRLLIATALLVTFPLWMTFLALVLVASLLALIAQILFLDQPDITK